MITVTARAASALQQVLVSQGAPPDHGIKLVPGPGGGIAMSIGLPADEDQVVRSDEKPVVIVDRQLADSLHGSILDVEPDEGGEPQIVRFTLEQRAP